MASAGPGESTQSAPPEVCPNGCMPGTTRSSSNSIILRRNERAEKEGPEKDLDLSPGVILLAKAVLAVTVSRRMDILGRKEGPEE